MVPMDEELIDELFLMIGKSRRDLGREQAAVIRKAAELYAMLLKLEPMRGRTMNHRRRKLGISIEAFGHTWSVGPATVSGWEKGDAPVALWVGPILEALEERRRDEERRGFSE